MANLRFQETRIINRQLASGELNLFSQLPQLKGQKRDFLCPFIVYLGNVNSTNLGEVPGNSQAGDFTTFKKIFTGKDSQIAVWENSTVAELINPDDTYLTKKFQVGKYILGYRIANSTATTISPTNQLIDAIQESTETTMTFIVESWEPSKDDQYKLWVIPSQGTSEFFYMSQAIKYHNPDNYSKVIWTEITFISLNDKLAQAGQQISQYVSNGAPGEGYAFPQIEIIDDEETIILSQDRLQSFGITEIQVEMFGPGIITSLFAMGRRVDKSSLKVEPSRFLFSYAVNTPIASDLNQKTNSENNYYFIQNANITINEYYSNYKDNMASRFDPTKTRNYEGYIKTNETITKATNPTAEGLGVKDIWDKTWSIAIDDDGPDTGYSNNTYNTNAIAYASEVITIPNPSTPSALNMLNSIIFLDTERLNVEITETTVWSTKSIPLVGGMLNILTLGIPLGWQNTNAKLPGKLWNGFIPKNLYDMISNDVDSVGKGNLNIEAFKNDTADSVGMIVGTNSIGTSLNISLTDKILQSGTIRDTLELGQPNGFVLTGAETPAAPALTSDEGFAIDFINVKMIGKCDFKITAYRNGVSRWEGYFQSRAKFTNSIREWSNSFKLSAWSEVNNQYLNYPGAVPDKPPTTEIFNIVIANNHQISDTALITHDNYYYKKSNGIVYTIVNLIDIGYTWETLKTNYESIILSFGSTTFYTQNIYNNNYGVNEYEIPLSFLDIDNDEYLIDTIKGNGKGTLIQTDNHGNSYNRENQTMSYTQEVSIYRLGDKILLKIDRKQSIPNFNYELNPITDADKWYYSNQINQTTVLTKSTFKYKIVS